MVNDDLRYMRWTATGSGPEVLRVDDLDRLRDTESLSRASSTKALTAGSSS